jgi:prophage antirepressor-like protein
MNVQLFQHPDFGSLTTFKDNDGREYYKAHDVCLALRLSNPSQQIKRHVKTKWVFEFDDGYTNSGKALYLCEAGFNALIFKSKTPQAEKFQDWVFEEVLPKLRASGGYIMPTATSEQLKALSEEIVIKEAEILELQEAKKLLEASTEQAKLESKQALEVTQKILRYFLALNRVAWNLYIDLSGIDAIARKENKTDSDWERIDRTYRNAGGTALCFIRKWRENVKNSKDFLCVRSVVVNPDESKDLIMSFWNYLVKNELDRNSVN